MEVKSEIIQYLRRCTGLTGSIASGKSTVAKMFTNRGGHIIDTDLIAREVVEPGMPALRDIEEAFGSNMLHSDGTLNREALREVIVHDSEKRKKLDAITHPRINEMVYHKLEAFRKNEDGMPIFVDVPLLYETGWNNFFDSSVLVYVTADVQLKRLMARDGLDEKTARATIATQMSLEEKKTMAAYIIDNSGTLEETEKEAQNVFEECQKKWRETG